MQRRFEFELIEIPALVEQTDFPAISPSDRTYW